MSRPCVAPKPDSSLPAPDLTVLDLDSPYVRALHKKNKRRQGWSLSMLFKSPRPRPAPPANLQATMDSSTELQDNNLADAFPSSYDLSQPTRDFLSALRLETAENYATSHCWWASAAPKQGSGLSILDLMLRAVSQASLLFGLSCSAAWALLMTPVTTTEQIAFAVTALANAFHTGLLIAHDPGSGVYLFRPALPPKFVTHSEAIKWKRAFPETPVMLFSQTVSSPWGHFQRCLETLPPNHDTKQASSCVVACYHASASPAMSGGTFKQRFQNYARVMDLEPTIPNTAAVVTLKPDPNVEADLISANGAGPNPLVQPHFPPSCIDLDSQHGSHVESLASPYRALVELMSDDSGSDHAALAEPVPGSLTPLPWQDSISPNGEVESSAIQQDEQAVTSPTLFFEVAIASTQQDSITPALTPLPWQDSISPNSEAQSSAIQQEEQAVISPTLPFEVAIASTQQDSITPASETASSAMQQDDKALISAALPFEVPVASTWLDRLHPSPSGKAEIFSQTAPSLPEPTMEAEDELPANFCSVCHAFHLQACHCLQLRQSEDIAASVPSPSLPGCSCVGVYGLCLCGFAPAYDQSESSLPRNCAAALSSGPKMEGASFANLRVSTQVLDLDSDLETFTEGPSNLKVTSAQGHLRD